MQTVRQPSRRFQRPARRPSSCLGTLRFLRSLCAVSFLLTASGAALVLANVPLTNPADFATAAVALALAVGTSLTLYKLTDAVILIIEYGNREQ